MSRNASDESLNVSSTPLRPPTPASSNPASQAFLRAQDSGINTHAIASSSSDGGAMFQSATNFGVFGGNFLTVTVNANLKKDRHDPQSDSESNDREAEESARMVQEGNNKEKQGDGHDTAVRLPTSPTQSLLTRRSCDIYYQHVGVKRRGSPLWIPEPNKQLHISYQRKGMNIGDVGIITDSGSFDFLFNICLPQDHPVNSGGVPEHFVPFPIRPADIRRHSEFKGESYLSSASIKKSQRLGDSESALIFEASASEGAILTMPVGLKSEDLGNVRGIRKYAAANAEHWYRYVIDIRGREVNNGDVRLVIGSDKTTAWGIATFSNLTAQTDSFHLKFRPVEQNCVGKIYEWEHSGMAEVRAGPDSDEIEALRLGEPEQQGAEYENQCLFVRNLNITLRDDVWKKLQSELGDLEVVNLDHPGYTSYSDSSLSGYFSPTGVSTLPVQPAADSSRNQSRHFSSLVPTALTGHPSGNINERMLKLRPRARMAISEDNDWISVITKDDYILPAGDVICERMMAGFIARQEEDIVFLEKLGDLHTGAFEGFSDGNVSYSPLSQCFDDTLSLFPTHSNPMLSPLYLSSPHCTAQGIPAQSITRPLKMSKKNMMNLLTQVTTGNSERPYARPGDEILFPRMEPSK